MPIRDGLRSRPFQSASESVGGRTPSGMTRWTQTAPIAASKAIAANDARQPMLSPIHEAIGTPITEAADQPLKIVMMARPRSAGGAITPIAAAACGVKTAAPSTVSYTHL